MHHLLCIHILAYHLARRSEFWNWLAVQLTKMPEQFRSGSCGRGALFRSFAVTFSTYSTAWSRHRVRLMQGYLRSRSRLALPQNLRLLPATATGWFVGCGCVEITHIRVWPQEIDQLTAEPPIRAGWTGMNGWRRMPQHRASYAN